MEKVKKELAQISIYDKSTAHLSVL